MAGHVTTGGDTGTGDTGGGQQQSPQEPVTSDSTTGGEIHADPGGMRSGAEMFDSAADYAEGIGNRFLSGTARLQGVWGTDDTGKNFAKTYLDRITKATDALKSIQEGLTALPDSVNAWADGYAQAEEDNATIADNLSRQLQTESSQFYQPGSGAYPATDAPGDRSGPASP